MQVRVALLALANNFTMRSFYLFCQVVVDSVIDASQIIVFR